MGDFFDPTAPLEDFSAREEALKRLLARANALRGTTPLGINPEENMVSGHFVTPWAKIAQMAINPISAAIMDRSALDKLQALNQDKSTAAREIIDQLPKVKGKDGKPTDEIDLENRGAIAKLALLATEKGLMPREEGIAKIFETLLRPKSVNPFAGLSSPVIRDENGNMIPNPVTRQIKEEDTQSGIDAAGEREERRLRARAEWEASHPKPQKTSEKLQEIQAIKTMDKLENGENLPAKEMTYFTKKRDYLNKLDELMGSYQPEYSANPNTTKADIVARQLGQEGWVAPLIAPIGGVKSVPEYGMVDGKVVQTGKKPSSQVLKDAAYWWARMEELHNADRRHDLYGAALKSSEEGLFSQQTLNPGTSPDEVIKFFKEARERAIKDLGEEALAASREYDTGGQKKAFEDVYGGSNVIPLHQSIVPQRSPAAVEQANDTREPDNDDDDGDYGDLPEEARGDKQVARKHAPGTVVDRIRSQPMQEVTTKSGKKFRILPPLER